MRDERPGSWGSRSRRRLRRLGGGAQLRPVLGTTELNKPFSAREASWCDFSQNVLVFFRGALKWCLFFSPLPFPSPSLHRLELAGGSPLPLWLHTQRSCCPNDMAVALPAVNHFAIVFEALLKGGTVMNLLVRLVVSLKPCELEAVFKAELCNVLQYFS